VAYPIPTSAAPLSLSLSSSTARLSTAPRLLPSLSGALLWSPPSLSGCAAGCSAPFPLSPDALPAALLPSLAAPLPDLQPPPSPSRSSRLRRGDGGIERTATRRWRNRGGVSTRIRRQGAALPLRRAGSAPTLKRRLGDD
jgi:hypothetical protein